MTDYNPYCLSSFLALRYVARPGEAWTSGCEPEFPDIAESDYRPVRSDPDAIRDVLAELVPAATKGKKAALLLSGGIDSAILGALMGQGHKAYTIRFIAEGAADESAAAAIFADRVGLEHEVVDVPWSAYEAAMPTLMRNKKAPLHPVEVGLYEASRRASEDGFDSLVVGIGADSTFGGLDKLLSRDWSFDEFVARYTFIDPTDVLRDPRDMGHVFEPYRRGDAIDVQGFLKVVHGLGIVQAFESALLAGGCEMVCPFEEVVLDSPLDIPRIRAGESKYLLRAVFRDLYEGLAVPEKIAFARPMDVWLADYAGPKRGEFLPRGNGVDWFAPLSGEQRWLLYCLESFLEQLDRE